METPLNMSVENIISLKLLFIDGIKDYDETDKSLVDKSHRPLSNHPNAHNNEEITRIKNFIRRNPKITLCELWYKLKVKKGYTRHIGSLYRVLRKLGMTKNISISGTSK